MNLLKDQKISRIHGKEEEGISWGMGFEEDEIAEYQKKVDEEGDDDDESREGDSDSNSDDDSDEDVKLLNVEVLR